MHTFRKYADGRYVVGFIDGGHFQPMLEFRTIGHAACVVSVLNGGPEPKDKNGFSQLFFGFEYQSKAT